MADKITDFCAGLSSEQFASCMKAVIDGHPKLREPGRDFLMKMKNPRRSLFICREIYAAFGPDAEVAATSRIAPPPTLDLDELM